MVEIIQVQVQMDKRQVEVEQLLLDQMQHQVLMDLVVLVQVFQQLSEQVEFQMHQQMLLDILPVEVDQVLEIVLLLHLEA
jgi:hypothetical protein|tara:strand:- start:162 stop:401 length:240 start_codon:yes stop_codon:yes gene_type:complete